MAETLTRWKILLKNVWAVSAILSWSQYSSDNVNLFDTASFETKGDLHKTITIIQLSSWR